MGMDLLRCGVDGFGGWRPCLATNGSLFSVGPLTKIIGFNLGNPTAHGTGGWYGRGLPVPMHVKAHGTTFSSVVNFSMPLTRFHSVIACPVVIMM